MKRIYILFLLFIAAYSHAQQSTFRIQYNFGQFDIPGGMVQAPSNNYVFSSTTIAVSLPIGPKGGLTEVDLNGNHVRSTLYNNSNIFSTSVEFNDVKNISGGGYIVTGSASSQCLVAKIPNTFGTPTWQFKYIPVSGSNAYGSKIIQTTDGGFLIAGSANHVNNGISMTDSSKMFVLKVNTLGAVVWSKVFFYSTSFDDDDYLSGVTEVSDGYVFVGSATTSFNGSSRGVIIKTNTSGAIQWARQIGADDIQSVITDSGNDIVMSGLDNVSGYIDAWSAPNAGPTTSVAGIANTKYTATGLPVSVSGLTKTFDNNFAAFTSGASFSSFTTIIVKANRTTGAVMFDKSYNSFISILPVGIQALDSGFLMNSLSADTAGGGGYDFAITKTDMNGNQGGTNCPASTPPMVTQSYNPSVNSFTPVAVGTGISSSGGITAVTSTPSTVINCRSIACIAPPQPTVTSTGNNICPGTQVTINASGGSNVAYHIYTQASGGISIGDAPKNVTPGSTTTYFVEADDNTNAGCVSTRGQVTVTVLAVPQNVSATANPITACAGATIALTGGGTGATSWAWSGPNSFSANTQNASVANALISGTYTVTATNTCGTATASTSVTINQPPTAISSISGATTPCIGVQNYTVVGGAGATAYSWSVSGGGSITPSGATASVNWTTAGTYTVSVTATNTCGTVTGSVSVTVLPNVSNVTATATSPVCSGANVQLNASGNNVTNYSWSGPNGFTAAIANPTVNNIQSTGTYVVTASNTCNNATASVSINVNQTPATASATASPNPICAGNTLTLTAGGVTGATFVWTYPDAGVQPSTTSTTLTRNNVTTAMTGTYSLSQTVTGCTSTTAATVTVTVSATPVISSAVGVNPTVCGGTNGTITLSGLNPIATYTVFYDRNGSALTPVSLTSNGTGQIIMTGLNAGSYTNFVATINGCPSLPFAGPVLLVEPSAPSAPTVGSNSPVCATFAINLTASGAANATYNWTGPNSFTASTQNPSLLNSTTAMSGSYCATQTVAGCTSPQQCVTVTVNDKPQNVSANVNPNDTVCAGSTISLVGNGTGATTWSWSGANSFSAATQNTSVANAQTNASGVYTITATNTCGTATASVNVTVNQQPQNVSANAAQTNICNGRTLILNGNANGATTFAWSGPNGFSSAFSNDSIVNTTFADSGLYIFTATNDCGVVRDSVAVDIDSTIYNVASSASPNDTLCTGGTISLNTGGVNVNSWSWNSTNGFSSTQQNPSISNAQPANSGTYTVTASNACGSATASVNILVNDSVLNLNATASQNGIVCSGTTVNLSATGNNINSFSWTGPNGFSSSQQNVAIINATIATSGLYTVTAFNGCKNLTDTVSVRVDTLIQNFALAASTDSVYCAGETIQLSANGTNVVSWNWSFAGTTLSTQQSFSISNAQATNSGIYTIAGSNACGSATASVNVLVNNVLQTLTATASSSGVICSGGSVTLSATASDVNTWLWTGPNGFSSTQQNPTINPATTANSGTYTIAASNACGNRPATVTVTVDTAIQNLSAVALSGDTVCAGATINLSATGLNVTSWHWTGPNNFTSSQQNPTLTNVSMANSGTYIVTGTNGCGSVSLRDTVFVRTIPQTPSTVNGDETNCGNVTAIYTVSNSANASNYTWTINGGGTNVSGQGTNSIAVAWGNVAGNYSIEVSASNDCGSSSPTSLLVNVSNPTVSAVDIASDTICYNTFTTLTAHVSPAGTTVVWTDAQGNVLSNSLDFGTPFLTQTTTFYVHADSTACPVLQGRIAVNVYVEPLPVVTLTSDKPDNTIFPNEVLTFTALPDSFINYTFYVNGVLVKNGDENFYASSKFNDLDSIWVIATAKNGCESLRGEDTVHVVDFPNAFTPNSDKVNDVFLKDYDLVILNRWGQELYRGKDGWDGKYKGDKVSPGTYYYIVTLERITDRKNEIKGTVLVIED